MNINRILIIQTAFIGDVVLATGLIEKFKQFYPESQIDFLLRKGNESVLQRHPYIHKIITWNKKQHKYRNLIQLISQIRTTHYDLIINLQRFAAMGVLTAFSGARQTVGFKKNPLSILFTSRFSHTIGGLIHEYERNHQLVAHLTDNSPSKPKLYPSIKEYNTIAPLITSPYICIAPTSVWFTKQFPESKWVELINHIPENYQIYLLGSPSDKEACERILKQSNHKRIRNLAGELSLLSSAALMQQALMNYVNDSAPMHLASAMNAPTCTIYCSTIPAFGFGPLSEKATIIERDQPLYCRPCGLHGYKACPEKHFKCANDIDVKRLSAVLESHNGKTKSL